MCGPDGFGTDGVMFKRGGKAAPAAPIPQSPDQEALYGTGLEAFVVPNGAKMIQPTRGELPRTDQGFLMKFMNPMRTRDVPSGEGINQSNRPITKNVADIVARNAELARKSAIMSLGLDPRAVAVMPDGLTYGGNAGMYGPKIDLMVSDADAGDYSTMGHESLHRGLEDMRRAGGGFGLSRGIDEENLVRYIMRDRLGVQEHAVPEKYKKQDNRYAQEADRVEAIAARLFANRRPGGPR